MTAQRREERLQDVPAAITALTGDALARQNVTDSSGIARLTPGLRLDNTAFAPQPTLRGIGSRSLSPGEESTVPIFIDGVYLPFPTGNVFQLQNIERVEVLKGPQGALYGRNSTGGAINVVTAMPKPGFSSQLEGSYGRFDDVILRGSVEGGSDAVRANLNVGYRHADGYLHDIITGGSAGGVKSLSIRGKVVFLPTDRLTITLAGSHDYLQDLTANQYQALDGNTAAKRLAVPPPIATGRYEVALGGPVKFSDNIDSASLTAKWDLGGVALTGLTSYVHLDYDLRNFNNAAVKIPLIYDGFSKVFGYAEYNELYLQSSNSSPFQWLAGGTYYHVKTGYAPLAIYQQNVVTGVYTFSGSSNFVTSNAFAAHAQASYSFNDHLLLSVAGRYTTEKVGIGRRNFASGVVPNIDVPITVATVPDADASQTFNNFSPSATLQYKFSRTFNIYAKISKGFKSGVFSPGGTSLVAAKPERITQYEAGLKAELRSGIRLSIAGYHADYSDIQVQARNPVTNLAILQNATSATINGGEIEFTVTPVRKLNLNAGLSITDGRYGTFLGAVNYLPATTTSPAVSTTCTAGTGTQIGGNRLVYCDVSGNRLLRVPLVQFNAGGNYRFDVGNAGEVGLNVNAQYESSYYWDTVNRVRSSSRTLVDSEVSFTPRGTLVTFSVWGKNLLNEFYYRHVSPNSLGDTLVPAEPSTYGVRVRAKF